MKAPETFTSASFRPFLNQRFKLSYASARLYNAELETALELVDVRDLPEKGIGPSGRQPFSICFRGDLELILPQTTYKIEHKEVGTLYLFLVPLSPDEHGARYEAVFN